VGSTTDLDRRIIEHNRGKEKFTMTGMPWLLVYNEIIEELIDARRRERYIKKQKSRQFIESLIGSTG
jgi:putative endonuclease